MKQRRSLDHDGLDGILQPSDKQQSKPAWFRSLWTIPIIIVLAVSVFLLQKLSQTPSSTTTTLAQISPSTASEQISSAAPVTTKQALTTPPENSKAQVAPAPPETTPSAVSTTENSPLSEPTTNAAPVNDKQTIPPSVENNKAQAAPAAHPVVSTTTSGNDAKPSADVLFTVYFKLDSNKPSRLSKTETRKLINLAKRCQNLIGLTGYSCNLGTDAVNLQLGWARANALKKLLTANGIPAQHIITASEGMRKPAASNDTKSGRALNRRAELYCLEH
jgi:outer membrane protein OmpA-like peptidoglycan-associated protein